MKVLICDYKEPLNRDIEVEKRFLREGLGEDLEIEVFEYKGDDDMLIEALADVDAVLTAYLKFDERIISSAKKLKFISIEATGYNFIDIEAAAKNNVGVSVIGEYCTQEVADHTIALALGVCRNFKKYTNDIEINHKYDFNIVGGMIRLDGSTFGIMGLGKIGRAVAKRAQGFGMKTIAFDPFCPPELAKSCDTELVSLDKLLEESNIISLNMLLTPETTNILNKEAFLKMKKKPVIVNVSRGAMINEDDLVWALDNDIIYGAGLDVLVDESYEGTLTNPLVGRDNVLLTPHTAFYSDFSMLECARISSYNIVNYLKGEPNKVNRMLNNCKL